MAKLLHNPSGRWWRFTKYDYVDGYLRPAPDAKLEWYDPWALHERALHDGDSHPVDDLLRAHQPDAKPNAAAAAEWSTRYGPLGILLYRSVQVALAPRLEPVEHTREELERIARALGIDADEVVERLGLPRGALVSYEYRFGGGAWLRNRVVQPDRAARETRREAYAGHALMRADGPVIGADVARESLEESWGKYFPDVAPSERATYAYPLPNTEEFARAYCEPFVDWASRANQIAKALAALARGNTLGDRMTGAVMLSTFAQPSCPLLRLEGPPRLEWRSPALLSSLALMAIQRVAAGGEVRICKDPKCGAAFMSVNPRAEYDSDRCRWRHHKEVQRTPKTRARRSRTKGSRNEKTAR